MNPYSTGTKETNTPKTAERTQPFFPWWTCILSCLCICLTAFVVIRPDTFDTLAMWSQPEHFWQYFSGIFIHGIEPRWFAAVHLGLNMLGLIPLGILCERTYGTKRCLLLFFAEWLLTALLVQWIHAGEHTYAVGISSIVYALAIPAFPVILAKCEQAQKSVWKQPLFYYAIFEYVGLLSMLNPMNGVSSLLLHASGLLTGGVFWLLEKGRVKKREQ